MASSGFNPQHSSDTHSFIFAKITQAEGHQLVSDAYQSNNKIYWLLRESSIGGMLTVDFKGPQGTYYQQNSMRFALTENGWEVVSGHQIAEMQLKMKTAVTIENANKHIKSLIHLLKLKGFTQEGRLNPCPEQQTQNELYKQYLHVSIESLASAPPAQIFSPSQLIESVLNSKSPKDNKVAALFKKSSHASHTTATAAATACSPLPILKPKM